MCGIYMHAYLCAFESQMATFSISMITLHHIFEAGYLTEPVVHGLTRLDGLRTPGSSCLCLPSTSPTDYALCLNFYLGAEDMNSGPHAW